jgi:hypothetical protein
MSYLKVLIDKNREKFNVQPVFYIFVGNKMISMDSILPVATELSTQCGIFFKFYIHDKESYEYILNNIVIKELIDDIGCIKNISFNKFKYLKYFWLWFKVVTNLWIKKDKLIHFSALDNYPFKGVSYILPNSKIILSEPSVDGRYRTIKQTVGVRSTKLSINDLEDINKASYKAGTLLAYDKDWNYLKIERSKEINTFFFKEKRHSYNYVKYMNYSANKHANGFNDNFINSELVVVFILGHLGYHGDQADSTYKLYLQAMISLVSVGASIIMKPHVYCKTSVIYDLINDSKCDKNKVVISSLHQQVLMRLSSVSIFANYSTIRQEFIDFEFPVIQYGNSNAAQSNAAQESNLHLNFNDKSFYHIVENNDEAIKLLLTFRKKNKVTNYIGVKVNNICELC